MKIFLKTGCIVCALFLLGALFYEWIHSNIYITTSAHPDPHPISHLNTEQPVIALTFDTAAGSDSTDKILDILDKYKNNGHLFYHRRLGRKKSRHTETYRRFRL